MLLDETKMLDLTKANSRLTQSTIESFLQKHQRAGSGEVGILTGTNEDIRKQVTRSAFLNSYPVNYDYLYNNGCMIIEINN